MVYPDHKFLISNFRYFLNTHQKLMRYPLKLSKQIWQITKARKRAKEQKLSECFNFYPSSTNSTSFETALRSLKLIVWSQEVQSNSRISSVFQIWYENISQKYMLFCYWIIDTEHSSISRDILLCSVSIAVWKISVEFKKNILWNT